MSIDKAIDLVAVGLCAVGAVYAWLFVLSYSRDQWRTFAAGRHLMNFTRGLGIILTWSVCGLLLRALWPEAWWVSVVLDVGRILTFGWAAWMLRFRFKLLVDLHTDERNHGGTASESVR